VSERGDSSKVEKSLNCAMTTNEQKKNKYLRRVTPCRENSHTVPHGHPGGEPSGGMFSRRVSKADAILRHSTPTATTRKGDGTQKP